mmetsp:Transcript_8285/g.7867  ORF Transcript_8285/g.7867 Transcript_8285/m.7867 type:complete len:115 (-) Transcript_8285:87-431(-)
MKNKNDSDEDNSNASHTSHEAKDLIQPSPEAKEEEKEVKPPSTQTEGFNDNEFANSVKQLLDQRKEVEKEKPQIPSQNPHYQDILQIRNFYEHVQRVLPKNNLPPLNQIATEQR